MHTLMARLKLSDLPEFTYPFHIKPLIAILESNKQGCLYQTNGFGYRMTEHDRWLKQDWYADIYEHECRTVTDNVQS